MQKTANALEIVIEDAETHLKTWGSSFAVVARGWSDTFGVMQKTANALDIVIEDAETHLKTWGSQPPTYMLCKDNLAVQLTIAVQ